MNGEKKTTPNNTSTSGVNNNVTEEIYNKFRETLDSAKTEVSNVQKKLKEYDNKYQATENLKKNKEKATDFLNNSIEETKKSLDDLTNQTKTMFDTSKEVPMRAISQTLAKINAQIEVIIEKTKEYDEKYQVTNKVYDVINPIEKRLKELVSEISTYITQFSSSVFAQLKGVNDGLLEKLMKATNSGVNFLINTAANLDNKYEVENKLKEIDERYKITENVKDVVKKADEKLHVAENADAVLQGAMKLDTKYIDGKGKVMVDKAYEFGKGLVTENVEKFKVAKRSSRDNLQAMNGRLEK